MVACIFGGLFKIGPLMKGFSAFLGIALIVLGIEKIDKKKA